VTTLGHQALHDHKKRSNRKHGFHANLKVPKGDYSLGVSVNSLGQKNREYSIPHKSAALLKAQNRGIFII